MRLENYYCVRSQRLRYYKVDRHNTPRKGKRNNN